MSDSYDSGRPRTRTGGSLLVLSLVFLLGLGASAWFFRARQDTRAETVGNHDAHVTPVSNSSAGTAPSNTTGGQTDSTGGAGREAIEESLHEGRRTAVVRAAEKLGPSVVTVSVTTVVQGQGRVVQDFFWRWYVPGPRYTQRVPAGSGVIVDANGTILTNHHVVAVGTEYQVTLPDGRTMPATLKGSDPNYDLAVLKVDAGDLPAAEVGTSSDLMVGEWALAFGNPFGNLLKDPQPTVTVGVISALHRDVQSDDPTSEAIYKDLIQTDAAINPGNSGGALVNSQGQLIGINTLILSRSGGSEGVGFAIPIDTAMRVMREIQQYGQTRQIWVGTVLETLTPWLAQELRVRDPQGAIVAEVERGSPASRAGLRGFSPQPLRYDIIRKVNGEPVTTKEQTYRTFFGSQPGDVFRLTVEREDGRMVELPLKVELAPVKRGSQM